MITDTVFAMVDAFTVVAQRYVISPSSRGIIIVVMIVVVLVPGMLRLRVLVA